MHITAHQPAGEDGIGYQWRKNILKPKVKSADINAAFKADVGSEINYLFNVSRRDRIDLQSCRNLKEQSL